MFQKLTSSIQGFSAERRLEYKTIPLLILGIALVAFGIKTFSVGFFHDDWHHVYYAHFYGLEGLKQLSFFDSRPFAYFVYWPLFSLLGSSALNWHILVLVLRVLAVVIFLLCLNLIWPKMKTANGLAAIIFLVYPAFQAQPNSVSYALHWVAYSLFMLSILCMLLALTKGKVRWVFTFLSLIFQAFHLLAIEYFAGIELARPLLLWFLLRDVSARQRVGKVLQSWLPYLLVLIAYTAFRASFVQLLGFDRNSPMILLQLLSDPVASVTYLAQSFLQDLVDILFVSWGPAYHPSVLNFSVFTNLWVWGIAAFAGFASWYVFSHIRTPRTSGNEQLTWGRSVLTLGLMFVSLGLLPIWISGRTFFGVIEAFDDRLALPSMFGASMVWVGAINYFLRKPTHSLILVCTLVSLAVGLQLRSNAQYERAWQKQSQFYWQLYWRAPYIEPGTAFISEGEIFPLMGIHPTSYAINSLYPPSGSRQLFNYAFFASGKNVGDWEGFRLGSVLSDERFNSAFEGSSRDSLTILFIPEKSQCLWVLRPEDHHIRNLPEITYASLPASNMNRIHQTAASDLYPPEEIFGPEPEHGWCFYYQNAELSRQFKDWDTVTKLWGQAQQASLRPGSGPEFIVFIEGFAHVGAWKRAAELTVGASRFGNNIRPALCEVWLGLEPTGQETPEKSAAYREVSEKLRCNFE